MNPKVVLYFALLAVLVVGAFFLMFRTKKGLRAYFLALGPLLLVNMIHLNWLVNLPPRSGFGNLGPAVGYMIMSIAEAGALFLFALIWFIVRRTRKN